MNGLIGFSPFQKHIFTPSVPWRDGGPDLRKGCVSDSRHVKSKKWGRFDKVGAKWLAKLRGGFAARWVGATLPGLALLAVLTGTLAQQPPSAFFFIRLRQRASVARTPLLKDWREGKVAASGTGLG